MYFKHTLKEVHQSFLVGLLFIDVDFLFIYFVVASLFLCRSSSSNWMLMLFPMQVYKYSMLTFSMMICDMAKQFHQIIAIDNWRNNSKNFFCQLLWNILGLPKRPLVHNVTEEKCPKLAKDISKKPDGVSREVYALTGGLDLIMPSSDIYNLKKRPPLETKTISWQWFPFTSLA